MSRSKVLVDHVDSLLGSCRRRCLNQPPARIATTSFRSLCARIHARAAAEDDNRVCGSKIAHNDAFWSDVEDLVTARVRSIEDLFEKVRAGETLWRHELRSGEPFHDLLRDLIAEGRTVEERLLYAVLADVSELASRSLR